LTLKPKQLQAATLLAQGYSVTEVASMLEVNPATVWRWLKDANFQKLVNAETQRTTERLNDILAQLDNRLLATFQRALDRLTDLSEIAFAQMKVAETPVDAARWAAVAVRVQLALAQIALKHLGSVKAQSSIDQLGDLVASLQLSGDLDDFGEITEDLAEK
jgi:predicted transcriptional regulator